jgi:hypothetical protein
VANPNLSEIVTTTLRNRSKVLADNVTRNNALLTRLNKRGKIKTFSGGRTIVEELAYANNQTFQWYSGYQALNISPSTVISAAEYPIRQSAVAVSISGLEELQNSGENAVIDLLESRIENAEDTFMNGLAQAIYGDGSTTGTINGLGNLVSTAPTSGTVGGIDRSTWGFWRNIAYSGVTDGGAAITVANIYAYMLAVWRQLVRGPDQVDLIVADNNYWSLYNQALTAIQRVTDSNSDVAQMGFMSLKFMNSDVVLDGGFQGQSSSSPNATITNGGISQGGANGSTGNIMYFLNTKYILWRPHSDRNMVPLNPDRFSINQDAMVKLIGWAGNMTLRNAFLQGVLSA